MACALCKGKFGPEGNFCNKCGTFYCEACVPRGNMCPNPRCSGNVGGN